MTYDESLQYIHQRFKFGIKLGLERIKEILYRLGNPELKYPKIHIAGTNGKGSTAAMYDYILREAAYKTGRFTSPHLSSYRERITYNGIPISKAELADLMTELHPILEAVSQDGYGDPTEFEVGVALAFLFFARKQVEIAIIEVGMGGRFDATNVITPVLSVITHIALDHQQYLGDSLVKIAFEKAGIIKNGVPVVIGVQEPEIKEYLKRIAADRTAPVGLADSGAVCNLQVTESGTGFEVNYPELGRIEVNLGLIGRHQASNSLNVLAGNSFLHQAGFSINKDQIINGLSKTTWPGRFERIYGTSLPRFYLDGAHNPDGVRALVEVLDTAYPGVKADFLIGILNNRPVAEMAELLVPVARRVITTNVPDPKTTAAAELAEVFSGFGIDTVIEPDPQRALQLLQNYRGEIAVACGSLYLIGLLRSILLNTGD